MTSKNIENAVAKMAGPCDDERRRDFRKFRHHEVYGSRLRR